METLEAIRSRRSTRAYRDRPVEEEKLKRIVEAGRYAPSGGNSQRTHFLVLRNPEVLRELEELVRREFAAMEVEEGMYISMVRSIEASKTGNYVYDYHAPVLILTANQPDYGNNLADCACALENMMLAANALDLGSCWINQLRWLNENPALLAYLRQLGLGEGERVYGAVAIGYPATKGGLPARDPLPRTGNPVSWID